MAQVPECIQKMRLSVGDGVGLDPSQLSDGQLIELLNEAPKCPEAFDSYFLFQLEGEHRRRLSHSPSYRAAHHQQQAKIMEVVEQQELAATQYDVFDIDQFYSLPLPAGGGFSKWIDRMQGEQCLQVIDANQNHKPDDGDTCVGRNGAHYPDARFTGTPLSYSLAGASCQNISQFKKFGETCQPSFDPLLDRSFFPGNVGVTFDIHAPAGAEQFCMDLAGGMQTYGGRMKDQAVGVAESLVGSVEKHPVAAGAIVTVIGGLLAWPVSRGPTMAVLEWLGIGGAAVGTGGIVYDGVAGVAQYKKDGNIDTLQENMSKNHALWLLLMSGGMMRGVTVPQAVAKFVTGPERAAATLAVGGRQALAAGDELAAWLLGGGGGGFGPQLVFEGAGIGGGGVSIAVAAEGTGIVEGTAVAGGALTPGAVLGPIGPLVMARSAVVRTAKGEYALDIPDRFEPKAQWNGEAQELAKQIEGWMQDAAAADPSLKGAVAEVQSQLKAIREVYERIPDASVRQSIVRELSDINAAIEDAVNSDASLSKIGSLLRDGVRGKLNDILLEANAKVPNFSTFGRVKPPKFQLPPEGSGIEIHPAAVKEIGGSRPIADKMPRVYEIIDDFRGAGGDPRLIAADVEPWHGIGQLKKITFQDGPGYRVFFTWNGNGRAVILKAIPKPAPAAEAMAAQTAWSRAKEMGATAVFVLVIGEGVVEISEVPR